MTPKNIMDVVVTKDDIKKMLVTVACKQLKWIDTLWSDDLKVRAKNERYLKKHPKEAAARERSLMWLAKFATAAPNGSEDPVAPSKNPREVTTDQLEKMGHSDEELRRLAEMEE